MPEEPLDHLKVSTRPGERPIDKPDLPEQGFVLTIPAETETVEGKLHLRRGSVAGFEVLCDEPKVMGGDNSYPPPLGYLAVAVGF